MGILANHPGVNLNSLEALKSLEPVRLPKLHRPPNKLYHKHREDKKQEEMLQAYLAIEVHRMDKFMDRQS